MWYGRIFAFFRRFKISHISNLYSMYLLWASSGFHSYLLRWVKVRWIHSRLIFSLLGIIITYNDTFHQISGISVEVGKR